MKPLFYKHGALLIGLIPVLVYGLSCLLFEANVDTAVQVKKLLLENVGHTTLSTVMIIAEYKARILWELSALLSISAYSVAMAWSCALLYRCCQGGAHVRPLFVMGFFVVCVNLFQIIQIGKGSAMYTAIYSSTYDALGLSSLISDKFHGYLFVVVSLINLLAAITPVLVLVAVCAAFSLPKENANPDIGFFIERLGYVKQGVMAGSVILLFGIIHMHAWMQWPKALLGESDFAKLFLGYVHVNSQYWGVAFSLILFSLYIAAVCAIKYRAEEALENTKDEELKKKWFNENNYRISFQKHAVQLGMMLMPSLAGSFDSVFELL